MGRARRRLAHREVTPPFRQVMAILKACCLDAGPSLGYQLPVQTGGLGRACPMIRGEVAMADKSVITVAVPKGRVLKSLVGRLSLAARMALQYFKKHVAETNLILFLAFRHSARHSVVARAARVQHRWCNMVRNLTRIPHAIHVEHEPKVKEPLDVRWWLTPWSPVLPFTGA